MKAGPGNQRQFRSSFCTSTSTPPFFAPLPAMAPFDTNHDNGQHTLVLTYNPLSPSTLVPAGAHSLPLAVEVLRMPAVCMPGTGAGASNKASKDRDLLRRHYGLGPPPLLRGPA